MDWVALRADEEGLLLSEDVRRPADRRPDEEEEAGKWNIPLKVRGVGR